MWIRPPDRRKPLSNAPFDRILSQASARSRHGVDAERICGANPVTSSRFDTSCSLPSSRGIASPTGTAIAASS